MRGKGQSCILPAVKYFGEHPWLHPHLRKNKYLEGAPAKWQTVHFQFNSAALRLLFLYHLCDNRRAMISQGQ